MPAYSVEVLRELGYRVLEAHDRLSALRLPEWQKARVDLLFSDVVLPSGMTGPELVEAARALRPRLKVLFTTGYARNAQAVQLRRPRGRCGMCWTGREVVNFSATAEPDRGLAVVC